MATFHGQPGVERCTDLETFSVRGRVEVALDLFQVTARGGHCVHGEGRGTRGEVSHFWEEEVVVL